MEFWARLGQAIEPLLQGTQAMALCRNVLVRPLSAWLDSVDSPEGRQRVAAFLQTRPYPRYEPAAESSGLLVRIEADGKRPVGRFVNRQI